VIRDICWFLRAAWRLWRDPPGLTFLFHELPDELWPDPEEKDNNDNRD